MSKKKDRGSGTHGSGSKKKRRGAGSRGGRGKGGEKHRKLKYKKEGERKGKGFKRPGSEKEKTSTINLKELDLKLDELVEEGMAEKEGKKIRIDLKDIGYDKLLGSGKISRPVEVEAKNLSSKAKKKIEEAGGEATELS